MDPYPFLLRLCLVLTVLVAAATDLRRGKVYNWLTLPALLAGLLLHTLESGLPGLWFSLQGALLALLPLLLGLFLGQYLGGGDLKLLLALGALSGPVLFLHILVFSILAGGVLALVLALRRRLLARSLRDLFLTLCARLLYRLPAPGTPPAAALTLPYAVAIAAGALTALWYS